MHPFYARMLLKSKIVLCLGSSCFARGNKDIIPVIHKYISRNNLGDKVEFRADHCTGNCCEGPNIYVGPHLISGISVENIDQKLDEALVDLLKR
jgi:NADH:ubiquinone oxidoreductase subunit E